MTNHADGKIVCGVCGVGVRPNKNGLPTGGMYLCDTHRPFPTNCTLCPLVVLCNDRVHIYKLWVLCEMPTKDDFERMKMFETPESVAFPFKNNRTLRFALYPREGVNNDGIETKRAQENVFRQRSLFDSRGGSGSGSTGEQANVVD